jgi:hypothetical protein
MVLTFAQCRELRRQRRRKVADTTYVYPEGDGFGVRLGLFRVAHLGPDGSVTLYTCGPCPFTTRNRLNQLFRAGVYRRRFVWYVQGVPFVDGIRLLPGGQVDLLSALDIRDCPIDPAAPAIAADWLEEHGREAEAAALRAYLKKTAAR